MMDPKNQLYILGSNNFFKTPEEEIDEDEEDDGENFNLILN